MSLINPITALGALGSIFGAKKASRAQERAYEEMIALMRSVIDPAMELAKSWRGDLGKPSRFLKAEHEENIASLGRIEQTGLHRARVGRPGGGTGEQWRIRLATQRERNRANLGYGSAQESFLRGKRQDLAGLYTGIAGSPALRMMGEGMVGKGQAEADYWGDFSAVLGNIVGGIEQNQMMGQLFGASSAGDSSSRRRRRSRSNSGGYQSGDWWITGQ